MFSVNTTGDKMSRKYPSDVTRKQFELIQPILESGKKRTKPRQVDLYEIFCGILYVLKSGCQWRMLPTNYPKWQTCYWYFCHWKKKDSADSKSILERCLKKISWRGPQKQWSEREYNFLNY